MVMTSPGHCDGYAADEDDDDNGGDGDTLASPRGGLQSETLSRLPY